MARKPIEKKTEEKVEEVIASTNPGKKEVLPDGRVKTYHEGGIISIDN